MPTIDPSDLLEGVKEIVGETVSVVTDVVRTEVLPVVMTAAAEVQVLLQDAFSSGVDEDETSERSPLAAFEEWLDNLGSTMPTEVEDEDEDNVPLDEWLAKFTSTDEHTPDPLAEHRKRLRALIDEYGL